MKLKRLFSVIGLGLFAAVSAGAGVALNSKAKAESVKADADTWMVNISLNAKEIIEYEGFDPTSMRFHTYTEGVGNDKYFEMYPISTGSTFYQVNATFPDDYTYNRVQFKFEQGGVEKWSTPYNVTASKESHSIQGYSSFSSSWTGDNWNVSYNANPNLYVKYNSINYYFEPDIANKRFIAKDVISNESSYLTFYYRQSWDFAWPTLTTSSKEYTYGSHADNWFNLSAGTYDFVLKNNNSDNGVLQIYKHESESSYVYIVNESTDCYIYTFGAGGQERFGAFPGTQISDLISAGEAEDIGNSELSFQNLTTSILKVNVEVGYPVADHLILAYKNELGNVGNQTADMLLVAGSAYWFSNDADYHNDDAGITLDSLCNLRTALYGADGESVCNMAKADAEALVNEYNSLTAVQRETYFDCSELETLKRDGSVGHEFVNCKLIMEEVAKIAEIDLVGSPRTIVSENGGASINSTTLIAVISVIALVSVSSIVVLVVIKKRKHN